MQIYLGIHHNALIDYDDFAALHKHHWSARKSHSCWYAIRKETVLGIQRTVFMHRQIMNATPDQDVHHINHNTLDNRRANLKLVNHVDHAREHAQARLFGPSGPFHP